MDRDARQELHQRSLRNVRALLDQEEAEAARRKRAPLLLFLALIPAFAFIAAAVSWTSYARKPAATEPQLRECVARTLARMSAAHEREIRVREPGISARDVARKLQAENAGLEAAAARECGKGGG